MKATDFSLRSSMFLLIVLVLAACSGNRGEATTTVADLPTNTPPPTATTEPTPTDTPEPTATATAVPTDTPAPTDTPVPTDTPIPTATATPPLPIELSDELADDGCQLISLNPESWEPLFAAYKGGGDPFYHFHTNEPDFYFNLELYTVYGFGWTGQEGTFMPNCNGNGICVYLVPDAVNPYWATAGDVEIISLAERGGVISGTVEIVMSNLTLEPVPGTSSPGCYHVDAVTIFVIE